MSSILLEAIYIDNLEIVQECFNPKNDLKIDINELSKDKYKDTPLTLASRKGYLAIVELLIKNKADVNKTDYNGCTPLNLASEQGHLKIVELLIENKADVNIIDEDNMTALMWASYESHVEIVKHLLNNGADSTIISEDNKTALELTTGVNSKEIVDILEIHKLNSKNNYCYERIMKKLNDNEYLNKKFNMHYLIKTALDKNDVDVFDIIIKYIDATDYKTTFKKIKNELEILHKRKQLSMNEMAIMKKCYVNKDFKEKYLE